MIIDQYCAEYIVQKKYEIDVFANTEKIFKIARSFNMSNTSISKLLFKLRGLPENLTSLDGLKSFGFVMLGEKKEKEIVFGLVGEFWTFTAGVQYLTPQNFNDFKKNGFAKAVANIALEPIKENHTKVITETRVQCYGKLSTILFRTYWTLIAPFSGLIRKEWLKTIKANSESFKD
ncbi:MAG: hypothetical protein HGJ94_22545 [Desulfosarcina sp.]|nr:hypothetical protein [Desulfosarcina sp.]MBC2743241.1 hypothetical protein [Desulfosarcina sp.]MBC2766152.1 hypothetical protein [Desulfosarcina sp.]